MLIAQISDIHLGFEPGNRDELNRRRLDTVIDTLLALDRAPDLLLATGDLTEGGTPDAYAALREALDRCPWPVWLIPGNHDQRAPLQAAFPHLPGDGGFIHYVLEPGPLRIIMLDTLAEGRHGGSFCNRRADWLDARLSEAPNRPTLIATHHPPIDTGIGWMSADPSEPWVERLATVVRRHRQVVRIIAGHIHRPIVASWAGTTVSVCPSTAPQVALDLRPIDATPDGRTMIVAEPPGYALHLWTGQTLTSHVGVAGAAPVLARYTDKLQPLVTHLLAERSGSEQSHG